MPVPVAASGWKSGAGGGVGDGGGDSGDPSLFYRERRQQCVIPRRRSIIRPERIPFPVRRFGGDQGCGGGAVGRVEKGETGL